MTEFPDTHESLLVSIKDPNNREAWHRFTQVYRPVIHRLARLRGMQDADAQDLAQQVLIAVAGAIGRWQKREESIRFRHWLRRVARNAIVNALSRQPQDRAIGGTSQWELLADRPYIDSHIEKQIELEYRRELYLQAAEIVRREVQPDTWLVFALTVIDNHSIDEAAEIAGKSVGTVYAARSRIMQRLREVVDRLETDE